MKCKKCQDLLDGHWNGNGVPDKFTREELKEHLELLHEMMKL